MEVIVPITEPMREIINAYSTIPKKDQLVFPFLMGDAIDKDANVIRKRTCQKNKNIRDRLKKLMDAIGWSISLTGTYARHSFATNLHAAKVPMEYISDAMGHSLGNRGQITIRYISPYTIEERTNYNRLLLNIKGANEIAINERENIKGFNQGEALFVCGSKRMTINVVVTEQELDSFGSGGGL